MTRVIVVVIASVLLAGCNSKSNVTTTTSPAQNSVNGPLSITSAADWSFADVTDSLGVEVDYQNGEAAGRNTILESLGGGAGIFDYDRDGIEDLLFPVGGGFVSGRDELIGKPNTLLRGFAHGPYVTVTEPAGVGPSAYYTHGVAIADVDNDGFGDFLVTGYGGVQFWRNQGDGTFVESAKDVGLTDGRWSSSAAWGDLNGDGNVDLYIAHYVDWSFANNPICRGSASGDVDICPPRQFQGIDDVLYFSDGNGQFHDATAEAGLVPGGKGLGVLMADFDQDHDLDVYVANDTENNFLYWNDGSGHLKEDGILSGAAVDDRGIPNGSMGVAVADYDGDQQLDIFVANYEDEAFALYRQVAPRQFLHVSQRTGIASLGVLNVGFGSVMFDVEADGDPDVIVNNGHIMHYPVSAPVQQKVMLLENRQGQRFERIDPQTPDYLKQGHLGRGLAIGDLNGDGSPDLVFANSNQRAGVLLNRTKAVGRRLAIRLIGRKSNRNGIGALVRVTSGGRTQLHCVHGGGSYLSASAYDVWATISDTTDSNVLIEVVWPSGVVQRRDIKIGASSMQQPMIILEDSESVPAFATAEVLKMLHKY